MKTASDILIIDDDHFVIESLSKFLTDEGFTIFAEANGKQGIKCFKTHHPPIVLLDQELPDYDGFEVCRQILEIDPSAKIIFITAHASVRYAVDAMQTGAFNYLTKPFFMDELLVHINLAIKNLQLEGKLKVQEYEYKQHQSEIKLIGHSDATEKLREQIASAAKSDAVVLITGETGVGKNLVAREIHRHQISREPFLTINCSAIPENLIEAEYFGHEKGVFTGAEKRREGIFELANGGTLLLDEIGDVPYRLQSKLLSILEEKQIRRIGAAQSINIDVRIIAATNQDLEIAIMENRFRRDLYYRLAVVRIHIPPLRDHLDDVPDITKYFAYQFCGDLIKIPKQDIDRLSAYEWPGNVRELRNVIERASLLRQGNKIRPADFLMRSQQGARVQDDHLTEECKDQILSLNEVEKKHIMATMLKCSENKSQAARLLGISLSTLKRKLKTYN